MSTENAKIKVHNRTVEIKWVSEFCDHIMEKHLKQSIDHDLKFLEISKLLKNSRIFVHDSGRTWYAHNTHNGVKYRVVFILSSKFAVIKTCYRHGYKEN